MQRMNLPRASDIGGMRILACLLMGAMMLLAPQARAIDLYVPTGYATIQAAIDVANPGDVIHVDTGTYTEQLWITDDNLTIIGAGVGATIVKSPTGPLPKWFQYGDPKNYPVVFVEGADGFSLSNLTVDGDLQGNTNYRFIGIAFWNGGGSVTDVEVWRVSDNPFSGAQHGVGVYAYNNVAGTYSVALTRVLVDDYQKTAVALSGDGLTVALDHVTTVGAGPTLVTAQNGIQIGFGASGTITDCSVTGDAYSGESWVASGILLYMGGTVDITGATTVTGCQANVCCQDTDSSIDGLTITSANIASAEGISIRDYAYRGGDNAMLPDPASPFDAEAGGRGSRGVPTVVDIDDVTVTGQDLESTYGIAAWSYGDDVTVTVDGAEIKNWEIALVASQGTSVVSLDAANCSLADNVYGAYANATATQDLSGNWWGIATPAGVSAMVFDEYGPIDYTPWLAVGTDGIEPGFGGDFSTLWVDDDSPQSGTTGRIQEGVNLVSGSTVNIAAGTYEEQIEITAPLTLAGAGMASTIIQSPATLPILFGTNHPIVYVHGVNDVRIEDLTVDGLGRGNANYRFVGIAYYNAGGTIDACCVKDIRNTPISGAQHGVGIYTWTDTANPRSLVVSDCDVYGYQKNAMALNGPQMTATVDGCVVTGYGPADFIAQNGIQIGWGATGSIGATEGNVISGHSYTPHDWAASGILLADAGGTVTVRDNTVSENSEGIYCYDVSTIIEANVVTVTSAGTGVADYWGVICDPHSDGPFPPAQPIGEGEGRDGGREVFVYEVNGNTIAGDDGVGSIGLEIMGDGTDTMSFTGLYNDIHDFAIGVDVDADAPGILTSVALNWSAIYSNTDYGLYNDYASTGITVDATNNWWGDPEGPAGPPPLRAGNGVSTGVAFDPWIGKEGGENIVCIPDPLIITSTSGPSGDVTVRYLGGGSGKLYGYSMQFSWNPALVSLASVTQGSLLSSLGLTSFHVSGTGSTRVVDCTLLGNLEGATGPGNMFTIRFTRVAGVQGISPVDLTVLAARDKDNNPLSGFYPNDGEVWVDTSTPVVTNVFIDNLTLTNDIYVKNGDHVKVTATVTDDHGLTKDDIKADLSGLGRGATPIVADDYNTTTHVATWNEWTVVACTPADGEITVTVTATDWLGNIGQGTDTIIADNTLPTALAGLTATPGHKKVNLSWTNASGNDIHYAGVLIRYDAWGGYPDYVPPAPAYPGTPTAGDGTAFDGTGASAIHTFVTYDRDIYYYGGFVYDLAGNYSLAGTSTPRATNYWLGDVRPAAAYDGYVDLLQDIGALSGSYYKHDGDVGFENHCDVGPTQGTPSRLGIPVPDNFVNFEDLMIFSMNFGVVAPEALPQPVIAPVVALGPIALELQVPEGIMVGSEFSVPVRLEDAAAVVKGARFVVAYDKRVVEYLGSQAGALVQSLESRFFQVMETGGYPDVNVAALGNGVTLGGSGELVVLQFRCVGAGELAFEVQELSLRDAQNGDVFAVPSDVIVGPVVTLPQEVYLASNQPNPFAGGTSIAFGLPSAQPVKLAVYDVSGRLVRVLVDGIQPAGEQAILWDRRDARGHVVAGGMYLYRLETQKGSFTHKMIVMD
jgi:parallel beta-helix repeat protein